MTEGRTREIQLTAKQLVFIFMSTLLVAVVVFLLGVWVGRGIGIEQSTVASQADGVTTVDLGNKGKGKAADTASAKNDKPPEKYDYPPILQGSGPGGGAASQQKPAPDSAPPPAPQPQPPAPQVASEKPLPPAPAPAARQSEAGAESWYVQIDAFSSKANADRQAAGLKARGYSTLVTPGPPFKVRVGPFAQKAAAEQAQTRLRQEPGVKNPSVIASR
jgi:cell division septation protein DedD